MIANIISDIIFVFTDLFFPGGVLTLTDWRLFCQSMMFGLVVAGVLGWAWMAASAATQEVSSPQSVFKLNRPHIQGILVACAVTMLWAIIEIITIGGEKSSSFLAISTLFVLVFFCLGAWFVESILVTLYCRLPHVSRYRYVTVPSRRFFRRG